MDEYRPNSRKSKEESVTEKKIEKVISGSAKQKKKNDMQKFAELFVPEDVGSIKTYILLDVIIPLIKKALSDTLDAVLYPGGSRTKNTTVSNVSYNRCFDKPNERRSTYNSSSSRGGFDYEDIIFNTRGDAETVLDAMNEVISRYGVISVADLYDLSDVSMDNYTANKYGWTDISGCKAVRIKDGYVLKLPRALPLN